ncbi:hypothetical protein CPC08DRAFT_713239 [Agrocybe pediades]|nr:hypothetical protein CPC08DRAFT_713239 [Agrocybe pediades]
MTIATVSYTTQGLTVHQQSTEPSLGDKVINLALVDHFAAQIQDGDSSLSMADPKTIRPALFM